MSKDRYTFHFDDTYVDHEEALEELEEALDGLTKKYLSLFGRAPLSEEEERIAQSIFSSRWNDAFIHGEIEDLELAGKVFYLEAALSARSYSIGRSHFREKTKSGPEDREQIDLFRKGRAR